MAFSGWRGFRGRRGFRALLSVRFASQPLAVLNGRRDGAAISDKPRATTSDSKAQEYFLFKALELLFSS